MVGLDGRFRLGPLVGAYRKDAPAWIGAGAREQARQRRMAELHASIETLRGEITALTVQRTGIDDRLAAITREIAQAPSDHAVTTSRARHVEAGNALGRSRRRTPSSKRSERRQSRRSGARRRPSGRPSRLRTWSRAGTSCPPSPRTLRRLASPW